MIMTKQNNINALTTAETLNKICNSLIKIGYVVNSSYVQIESFSKFDLSGIWKNGLEVYNNKENQIKNITDILDELNIKYNVTTKYTSKRFPIIIFENDEDFKLLLNNITKVKILEIVTFN